MYHKDVNTFRSFRLVCDNEKNVTHVLQDGLPGGIRTSGWEPLLWSTINATNTRRQKLFLNLLSASKTQKCRNSSRSTGRKVRGVYLPTFFVSGDSDYLTISLFHPRTSDRPLTTCFQPSHLRKNSNWSRAGRPGFNFCQGHGYFLLASTLRPTVIPIRVPRGSLPQIRRPERAGSHS
jgi:hypothetical protein